MRKLGVIKVTGSWNVAKVMRNGGCLKSSEKTISEEGRRGRTEEGEGYIMCQMVKPPTQRATTPEITANSIH